MEAQIIPLHDEDIIAKYSRTRFTAAGMDDFTEPPTQNPDLFMQLINVMPPITGVFVRRWGYRYFEPKLDADASPTDDSLNG
jgi:hypothetical protein